MMTFGTGGACSWLGLQMRSQIRTKSMNPGTCYQALECLLERYHVLRIAQSG